MNRTGLLLWIAGGSALTAWEFVSALAASGSLSAWGLTSGLVTVSGAWLITLLVRRSNAAKTAYSVWTMAVFATMLAGQLSATRSVPWIVWIIGVIILGAIWSKTKDVIVNYPRRADSRLS